MTQGKRTLLGFDYGKRNIGVAVGQEITASASPLVTLKARDGKPDWMEITQLIETWRPDALVVGIPLHMDGTEQDMTVAARRFANQLQGRYHLPVINVDERLTSIEAGHIMRDKDQMTRMGKRNEDATTDQIAAQLILTQYLNELHNHDHK